MVKDTLLSIVRNPLEALRRATADEVEHHDVYGSTRTRAEGLYTQTSVPSGVNPYAVEDRSEAEDTADTDSLADEQFDCVNPRTCSTCSPSVAGGD